MYNADNILSSLISFFFYQLFFYVQSPWTSSLFVQMLAPKHSTLKINQCQLIMIGANDAKLAPNPRRSFFKKKQKKPCSIHRAAARVLPCQRLLHLHSIRKTKRGSQKRVATSNHLSPSIQPLTFWLHPSGQMRFNYTVPHSN